MQGFADRFPDLARSLGPHNTETLLRHMSSLELPAGRRVIRDRMPVDSLYFILDGEVAIEIEEGGRAIALGRMGPGELLGEVSVLSGEMLASSTVVAEKPVKLLRLKHQAFEELIHSNAELGAAMLKHLVEMLAARLRMSQQVAAGPLDIQQAAPEDEAPKEGRNWLAAFFGKG